MFDDNTPSILPGGDETEPTQEALIDAYSNAVATVADNVGPAVVRVQSGSGRRSGLGSGVVIAGDGLVLTNSHVVGGARRVRIGLADAGDEEAEVLGDDPATDLALLRVELPRGAATATSASRKRSSAAIWSSPSATLGFESTITAGIVLGAGPLAALAKRSPDRRCHPDRRGAQSGQFRRCARGGVRAGGGHQHGHDRGRPGARVRGVEQHGAVRDRRVHRTWPRSARASGHCGANGAPIATRGPGDSFERARRAHWGSASRWRGGSGGPPCGRCPCRAR